MRAALAVLLFAVSAFAQEEVTAACGPAQTQFRVRASASSDAHLQAADPSEGMIYVIEEQKFSLVNDVTIRVAADGAWVGADRGNSYLFFSVEPGEHHLCADWIADYLPAGRLISLSSLTAEAGKTYYFRARTTRSDTGRWGNAMILDLDLLNSDEGKLLVASSTLAVSHPKK
jgi:hypothetical protein